MERIEIILKKIKDLILSWITSLIRDIKDYKDRKISRARKRKLYYLLFFTLFAVLLWAFITAEIITHNFNRNLLKGSEDRQEIDVSGIILTETKNGLKFWELYAETGAYNNNDNIAMLENIVGNFYKDKDVAMSFEATKGTYNEKRKQIILYDNTFIALKDGISLSTDRLIWSGSDQDILIKGNIKINKGNELIARGDEGVISSDYTHFIIIGKTQTQLYELKEKK